MADVLRHGGVRVGAGDDAVEAHDAGVAQGGQLLRLTEDFSGVGVVALGVLRARQCVSKQIASFKRSFPQALLLTKG